MFGKKDAKNKGIIPRTCENLLKEIDNKVRI